MQDFSTHNDTEPAPLRLCISDDVVRHCLIALTGARQISYEGICIVVAGIFIQWNELLPKAHFSCACRYTDR